MTAARGLFPAPPSAPRLPMPPRPERFAPRWSILTQRGPRNAVAGWPQAAFEAKTLRWKLGPLDVLIVNDPDAVGRVLVGNAGNYTKPRLVRRLLRRSERDSLIMADGDDWRMQRRVMAPVFTPAAVASLVPMIAEEAASATARWPVHGRVAISEATARATFAIISRALFSGEQPFGTRLAAFRINRMLRALAVFRPARLIGLHLPTLDPELRRAEAGSAAIVAAVERQVAKRRTMADPPQDFLQRLIDAFDAELPSEQATALTVDNAVMFYIAGYETTANLLAWALLMLALHPDHQERVRDEARAALASRCDPAALQAMRFTRAVIDETLRLYPSAPRFDREALGADELAGERFAKGQLVSIWPWLIHRHAALWSEPDAFRPERFLAGSAGDGRHRFQYLPFGAGPRVCIGAQLAITEALTILAHWLGSWRFVPLAGEVRPFADLTLKPDGGLTLGVERLAA